MWSVDLLPITYSFVYFNDVERSSYLNIFEVFFFEELLSSECSGLVFKVLFKHINNLKV